MTTRLVLAITTAGLVGAGTLAAQASGDWQPPDRQCGLRPGHFLVNSGVLYLQIAHKARFEDVRERNLRDAQRVLTEAVTQQGQASNPAAWYYLARFYLLRQDAVGADSAFRKAQELAPTCAPDIDGWRQNMWVPVINKAIEFWQGGNHDSAVAYFHHANAIFQGRPQGFLYLATLYANTGHTDSAIVYFGRAAEIATDSLKRQALFNLARMQHRRAAENRATVRWMDLRFTRDSIVLTAKRDSLNARQTRRDTVAARRAWARTRAVRDSIIRVAAVDSAAGIAALMRAIEAYRRYLEAFPNDPDGETGLAELYVRGGWTGDANALYESMMGRADSLPPMALFQAGYSLSQAGEYARAARAIELGLGRNPYYREGLAQLVRVYNSLSDTAHILAPARRLIEVDPLHRESLLLVAGAYQLLGNARPVYRDTTLSFLQQAESLKYDLTMNSFTLTDAGAELSGLVANPQTTPSPALSLVFEFMNGAGQVVTSQRVEIPALGGEQVHPIQLSGQGPGILAWRYRKAT